MKYNELHKELVKWKKDDIITEQQYETLEEMYKPKKYNIPRIHKKISPEKTMRFIAIVVFILGSFSYLSSLLHLPNINDLVVFAALGFIVAASMYFGDYVAGRRTRVLRYTGKAIMLVGCMLTSFILFYGDIKFYNHYGVRPFGNNWALFMLISSAILIPIAYKMREKVVLAYSLVQFVIWFISQGKISTGETVNPWLGMTFPTRFLLLSLVFLGLGYIHKHKVFEKFDPSKKYDNLTKTYHITGLLTMFIPISMASVGTWLVNPLLPEKVAEMVFVILTIGLALAALYIGLVKSNKIFFNFGLTFFIIEVISKFDQALGGKVSGPIYFIGLVIVIAILAALVEYLLTHRDELKEELTNKN